MTNSTLHYKRVVSAMIKARRDGIVEYKAFSDHDRAVLGFTSYEETSVEDKTEQAENQILAWMESYNKNLWENQRYYIEVWVEKKALQGVFQPICRKLDVALAPCKGYPSLTFLDNAADRFRDAEDTHESIILYFGDYDPSGEDIPRSIQENLTGMGVSVDVRRILLLEEHVRAWNLTPAPVKIGDSRTAKWNGLGQVELDAIEPKKLQGIIEESIMEYQDTNLFLELMDTEKTEAIEFRKLLKEFVLNIK
jgi:hypothetical protein